MRSSDEPHTRLTRMGDAAIKTFEEHEEYQEGDRLIVLADDGQHGGIAIHGYDDMATAAADALTHLEVMFKQFGISMNVVPVPNPGQG